MQCKLYVFEKTAQSWIERGRGLLRLNDMASTDDGMLQSRLGKTHVKCAISYALDRTRLMMFDGQTRSCFASYQ